LKESLGKTLWIQVDSNARTVYPSLAPYRLETHTDHYEYVCQYVTQGFATLATTNNTPIIFGILTTQTEELAYERAALDRMNKGAEFAETALFMIDAYQNL
jgi:6,7-dimethyl-8-ribityllumazine synthase